MAQEKTKSPIQYVNEIESVRLTNWFIRVAWKSTAGLIALSARLIASIILGIVRVVQRHRYRG